MGAVGWPEAERNGGDPGGAEPGLGAPSRTGGGLGNLLGRVHRKKR